MRNERGGRGRVGGGRVGWVAGEVEEERGEKRREEESKGKTGGGMV